jgi:4-amino-4-deoxy-L-arabinose transferase-like glycosyltransferase
MLENQNVTVAPPTPVSEQSPHPGERRRFLQLAGTVVLISACWFLIRLLSPPDLVGQDQERPAAYALDAVKNGHWLCQRDFLGDITSKPPLYTWLVAGLTLINGRINLLALYLPGALAACGTALLVLLAGRKPFGIRAAFLGSLTLLLTGAALKEFGLARTDGVFAFWVTAAALLAFRAWDRGGGWMWFWLAATLATLTKGPLGLVLGAGGLLACRWERKTGEPLPLRGSPLAGFGIFLLLCGGWFLLAWWQQGQAVVDKMIGKELVGHAVANRHGNLPGTLFYQPPLYFLARAAPWSLFAYLGFWRVWKQPAANLLERRFERFLFCWFFAGLFIFCIAPQQRGDHLWPLLPAGALLAGRELSRLFARLRPAFVQAGTAVLILLYVAGFAVFYFSVRPRSLSVQQTVALKQLARQAESEFGREFPLTHLDDRMTFQIYLNTLRPAVSCERAAALLRRPEAALVAVDDLEKLEAARQADDPPIFVLLPRPGTLAQSPTRIVANRRQWGANDSFTFCFGTLLVQASGVQLLGATEREFCFNDLPGPGLISFTNESSQPRTIQLRLVGQERPLEQERTLGGNESWQFDCGAAGAK